MTADGRIRVPADLDAVTAVGEEDHSETASQAPSNASGMGPANVATPTSPEPRSFTTIGRIGGN